MTAGGCLCGRVRFQVDGPLRETAHCHCTMCRRSSGAPLVTWTVADPEGFRWTGEPPAAYASSPGCVRTFCGGCGATLTFTDDRRPGDVDIAAGALDNPEAAPVESQIFGASRLSWCRIDPQVPFREDDAPDAAGVPTPVAPEGEHDGGCLCGAVRFSVSGAPIRATLCHCGTCRRLTGGPAMAWGVWERSALGSLTGTDAYTSSPGVTRRFCGRCGASVSFESDAEDSRIALSLSLLDAPDAIPPTDQTYVTSGLPGIVFEQPQRRWSGAMGAGDPDMALSAGPAF